MFLKKIEIQGFKSFADKVVINFDDPITGIVGPNGCGKSNISDAIRWVLGEQSVKSMRGSSMTDVIFNGSETRRKVNLAEVTLVFDNSHAVLNSDFEEIEVTRRLYRDTRESEYLINRVSCRLRDVHDLVLDTGLGRDSLSIISQGSISFFAEAKPIERRLIFEEAAGVSKYKKRKIEAISKLERTKENVDRMQDIVDEITRQVGSLKRAAAKAEKYKQKKALLESIEVSVLCYDITRLYDDLKRYRSELDALYIETAQFETNTGVVDHDLQSKRQEIFVLDQTIAKHQEKIMNYVRDISQLESKKIEIEQKRKYTVEVGNKEQKAKELYALMNDAKLEYEQRQDRHAALNLEITTLNEKSIELNRIFAEINQTLANYDSSLNRLNNKLSVLEHRLEKPFESQHGVQAVLNNRKFLFGVHDTVANVFNVETGFEIAISTALAGSLNHIVTTDDKAAVQAVEFLKKNMSGRATFIPLTSCRVRTVSSDVLMICNNAAGYCGVASDFIETESMYDILRQNLLGNVLIFKTIENANRVARQLQYSYKIVTVDGDVIHRGGTITGGKSKNTSQSVLTLKRDKEIVVSEIEDLNLNVIKALKEKEKYQRDLENVKDVLMQKRIALAQIEPILDVKKAKYLSLQQDYDSMDLKVKDDLEDTRDRNIVEQLNDAYMKRDELTSNLSLLREKRNNLSLDVQRKENGLRTYRKELNELKERHHQLSLKETRANTQLDAALERLSSAYQMTYEYALSHVYDVKRTEQRDEVIKLRSEIAALGNVNLDAPDEYKEAQERHEFLTKQLEDLLGARAKLLNVIDEMDTIMTAQFEETFNKINNELDDVFKALFGGGKARLILEDENDILNTGIDINVQPPGKSVQNIRLFSGGEKSLIAISVLFAILKARHVPLCIFDEVEAALDQANVERLAQYIRSFSNDTQFIIITHRSGTMAECDVLYGVTMPNRGVSSMLKVRLEEAIELKEEVA